MKMIETRSSVIKIIDKYTYPIMRATQFSNSISDEGTLEIVATLIAILKEKENADYATIESAFYEWSEEKKKFSTENVSKVFSRLLELNIFAKELIGYSFNKQIIEQKTMIKFSI